MKNGTISQAILEISELVSKSAGIQLGKRQAPMVEGRVKSRMLKLGIEDFASYLEFLRANYQSESGVLVSLLTTHYTFFFREVDQFDYVRDNYLAKICAAVKKRGDSVIRCWSVAASRGHEAYSLGMYLHYHLAQIDPKLTFDIIGTDIDPESIRIASNSVYHDSELSSVPLAYQQGHWTRGTGDISNYLRAKASLRDRIHFSVHNLLDSDTKRFPTHFDLILCRNLFIYFDPEKVKASTQKLLKHLGETGLLLVGISESLSDLSLPITSLSHSIYVPNHSPFLAPKAKEIPKPVLPAINPERLIRVLCIDDSPSVIMMLRQALSKEHGFEVIGVAGDGRKAISLMQELKPDAVTLDIHMPEMNGIDYLRSQFNPKHPPVIMVSSASREESGLAFAALRLGASDYVEKPSLADFIDRADEIRTKIKTALLAQRSGHTVDLSNIAPARPAMALSPPNGKLRIVIATLADKTKLSRLISDFPSQQPPMLILIDGAEQLLTFFADELSAACGRVIKSGLKSADDLAVNGVWVGDSKSAFALLSLKARMQPTSILVFGLPSTRVLREIQGWPGAQILMEDLGKHGDQKIDAMHRLASDVIPATSFAYLSASFLDSRK